MQQPEGINQLIDIRQFTLKAAVGVYQVRKTGNAEYGMFKIDGESPELVGYVTNFGYFFKVTYFRCGMTLCKEITYNEVIIKK